MLKKFIASICMILLGVGCSLAAIKVEDFLPPIQAKSEAEKTALLKVEKPSELKELKGEITEKNAVSGASAQDAINAWVEKRTQGATEIIFPSGIGFVATGIGLYENMQNPAATRISQRNAYLSAYVSAKKALAELFQGISTSGETKIFEYLKKIDEESGRTLTNEGSRVEENIRQSVNGFLRGYVIYNTYDDGKGRVYLTIVTTSKTQGNYDRPDLNSISASSIQDGVSQVFVEIERGLTPPVGGKMVFVPATGEMAFVGFGSAVVGESASNATQAKLELNAERVALVRAKDALCGVIVGENLAASEKVDSLIEGMSKEFQELSRDDPIVKNDPNHPGYVKLQQSRNDFLAIEGNSSMISGVRKGVMPPGVRQQSWLDGEKTFAYAVAVYLPSATKSASEGAKMMEQSRIMDDTSKPQSQSIHNAPSKPSREINNTVKQGPSGNVQSSDIL